MSSPFMNPALRQYQNAGAVHAAVDASPHKLISMLLSGALDRLASARGAMMRGETMPKLQMISAVMAIVEHLRMCLDHSAGGTVAANLDALYEYIGHQLLRANTGNDTRPLDEASELLRTIRSAWEGIGPATQH